MEKFITEYPCILPNKSLKEIKEDLSLLTYNKKFVYFNKILTMESIKKVIETSNS